MKGVLAWTIRSIDRSNRYLPPNLPLRLERSASLASHLAASLA
jgi:hypothetical protein